MSPIHRRLQRASLLSQTLLALALGLLSHSAGAQSATSGADLYAALKCGDCHGGRTIQTNVAHIQLGVDAANIKNASYGLVGIAIGTQMATYQSLSDAQFNDLAAFIAQQVGGGVVATCTSAGVPTATVMATPLPCANTGGTGTGGGTTGGSGASGPANGGGCTLGDVHQAVDPLWLWMLGGAALVLRRRCVTKKHFR